MRSAVTRAATTPSSVISGPSWALTHFDSRGRFISEIPDAAVDDKTQGKDRYEDNHDHLDHFSWEEWVAALRAPVVNAHQFLHALLMNVTVVIDALLSVADKVGRALPFGTAICIVALIVGIAALVAIHEVGA